MLDLSACTSAEHMLDLLAGRAQSTPPGAWVLAFGARPESWPTRSFPPRAALERAVAHRPLAAWCFDSHALVTTRAGLHAAGLAPGTPVEGGSVEVDASGDPTGLVLEHAALAVWNAVPEPEAGARPGIVRAACAHLAALGYSEIHDLKAQAWLGAVLAGLIAAGEISGWYVLYPLVDDLAETAAGRGGWESPRVRLGGGKIFVDGTLNSRTAWVLEPWLDAHRPELRARPCGTPMMTPAQIDHAVRTAAGFGLPIAAHAIGDGAVRAVLDAVQRSRPARAHDASLAGPHRVEHAELVHPDDIGRFAALGVVCSVQPCHLLTDVEALRRGAGDRLDRVLPLRSLIASGLEPGRTLMFGSDVPIVRADAGDSIRAAVARRRDGMGEDEAIGLAEAISAAQAWACFASG
jgi:hypothetical protein